MHFKNFIAWTYFSHPWLWPAYVTSQFAFIRTAEIKGLCLQLKRSGTKYAAKKINFWASAVANDCSLPLWKVSLGSDQVLMSYYLFIFSSHQHFQHMTSQILLILIDFDSFFRHFLIWNYSSLDFYNSGTLKLETVNGDLPEFCCSFNFGNIKTFHLHFKSDWRK